MSQKQIKSALISVFYKDGIEPIVKELDRLGVTIYSTGGTQQYIEDRGVKCVPVESLTTYPSILGGRVKTLHPAVFGGILARRDNPQDMAEMQQYNIPEIDLVIVDLYPFEETLKNTNEDQKIIEKIDVGGPSMIRAAAKNHKDLTVVADKADYARLLEILQNQQGTTTLEQRRAFAGKAFFVAMNYDIAINNYFNGTILKPLEYPVPMRYGENPHQQGTFYGELTELFDQLHGKTLSYNNLVDVDGAVSLVSEFQQENDAVFAIIKHTNVCGAAIRTTLPEAWDAALAGDPESAFGGILITNKEVDEATAEKISEIFFEVLIAPAFTPEALAILEKKKNRILLKQKKQLDTKISFKNILNGVLTQAIDKGNYTAWEDKGARAANETEKADLIFANIICKHLKSNSIVLVKNRQVLGKGCGQTSRIDALRQAVEKAGQFHQDLQGSVMASDAFFPFGDCVQMADEQGVTAIIEPGGSIRDNESIDYCKEHGMVLVFSGMRHFRHG